MFKTEMKDYIEFYFRPLGRAFMLLKHKEVIVFKLLSILYGHFVDKAPNCPLCKEKTELLIAHSRFFGFPVYLCMRDKGKGLLNIKGIKIIKEGRCLSSY